MRALIQRVSRAAVHIGGNPHAAIGPGLLVLLGVEAADGPEDAAWLAGKIARLRLFPDGAGVMNLSLLETGGDLLAVSQFTLHASTKKGNRPSYIRAAPPEISEPLYREFLRLAEAELARPVASGVFGAMMTVSLANEGPVTIWIDSKTRE